MPISLYIILNPLISQGGGADEDLAQAHRAYLAPPMPPR